MSDIQDKTATGTEEKMEQNEEALILSHMVGWTKKNY